MLDGSGVDALSTKQQCRRNQAESRRGVLAAFCHPLHARRDEAVKFGLEWTRRGCSLPFAVRLLGRIGAARRPVLPARRYEVLNVFGLNPPLCRFD